MNESTEIPPAADQSRRIKTREGGFTRLPPHDIDGADGADDVEMGTAVSGGPAPNDELAALLRTTALVGGLVDLLWPEVEKLQAADKATGENIQCWRCVRTS